MYLFIWNSNFFFLIKIQKFLFDVRCTFLEIIKTLGKNLKWGTLFQEQITINIIVIIIILYC